MRLKQKSKTNYSVLSCVLYSVMYNYVCIEYICCHSKTLINVSYNKIFEEESYNELLCIFIPGVLINLVYFYGFINKISSTALLISSSS